MKLKANILGHVGMDVAIKFWQAVLLRVSKRKQTNTICLLAGEHGFYVVFAEDARFGSFSESIGIEFRQDFDAWMESELSKIDDSLWQKRMTELYTKTKDWFFEWVFVTLQNREVKSLQKSLLNERKFAVYFCQSDSEFEDGRFLKEISPKTLARPRRKK